jgi:hypothetical protein
MHFSPVQQAAEAVAVVYDNSRCDSIVAIYYDNIILLLLLYTRVLGRGDGRRCTRSGTVKIPVSYPSITKAAAAEVT